MKDWSYLDLAIFEGSQDAEYMFIYGPDMGIEVIQHI